MLVLHHPPLSGPGDLIALASLLLVALLIVTLGPAKESPKVRSPMRHQAGQIAALTYRQGRRLVILLLGISVMLVGIAMIVLPGPALVVIPLGLAVLGIEFAWARRWLSMLRRQSRRLLERSGMRNGRRENKADMERPLVKSE